VACAQACYAAPDGWRHLARGFGIVGLQVFQLQFQLFDLVVEFFGLAPKLHATQFGDLQLQMLDLGGTCVQLRPESCHFFVSRQQ